MKMVIVTIYLAVQLRLLSEISFDAGPKQMFSA